MSEAINILVIDDDARIRLALEYNLRKDKYDVILAENGEQGFKMAIEKKPELILLDWMMPEMDGLETLRMLKGHYETRDIPVFMLTAKSAVGDVEDAMKLGADDYLAKPFNVRQIGNLLRNKLNKLKSLKE